MRLPKIVFLPLALFQLHAPSAATPILLNQDGTPRCQIQGEGIAFLSSGPGKDFVMANGEENLRPCNGQDALYAGIVLAPPEVQMAGIIPPALRASFLLATFAIQTTHATLTCTIVKFPSKSKVGDAFTIGLLTPAFGIIQSSLITVAGLGYQKLAYGKYLLKSTGLAALVSAGTYFLCQPHDDDSDSIPLLQNED